MPGSRQFYGVEAWESSVIRKALMACLVGLMLVPTIGQAQSNKEKAKQLFIEGRAAYKDGQYNKALQSFEKANQLKAHPLMLTNIAKVYEAMENLPKAIEFYRKYAATNRRTSHRSERRLRGYRRLLHLGHRLILRRIQQGRASRLEIQTAPSKASRR